MVASLILTSASCSQGGHAPADPGGTDDPDIPVLKVSASDDLTYLYVDGILAYRAVATYPDGSTQEVTDKVVWSSSNTTAASVDSAGLVTGRGLGKTVISAALGDRPTYPESRTALADDASIVASTALTVAFAPVISPMITARAHHSSNLLPDGRVLLAGGYRDPSDGPHEVGTVFKPHTSSTEYFDPRTGAFEPGPDMPEGRQGHTGTTLLDGSVLLAGGTTGYLLTVTCPEDGICNETSTQPITQMALLYLPETGGFADPIPMTAKRWVSTATLLKDGRVLLTGGKDEAWNPLSSAEIYDPTTRSFAATGSMTVPRTEHAAAILPSGKVLIIGGTSTYLDNGISSTEVFDPATLSFSPGPPALAPRSMSKAVSLPDGKVLVLGGGPRYSGAHPDFYEIYDETTNAFTAWPGSPAADEGFAVLSLKDGRVLIAGGAGWGDAAVDPVSALAQIYDPAENVIIAANRMVKSRNYPAATLLANGQVLITGGCDGWSRQTDTTEIFFDGDP